MNKKANLWLAPALLLGGCNLGMEDRMEPSSEGVHATGPTEWEPLPLGKSYLFTGFDTNGTPGYTPVKFIDTLAIIEGDMVIAEGAAAVEELRTKLVDPAVESPKALAKASGFVKTSTYTGGANAWPFGYVPFLIAGGDQIFISDVKAAVNEFNQGGGIPFVPWDGVSTPVAVFVKVAGSTSSSAVGMVSSASSQLIRIASGASRGTIMHEMGHAAGLYHEQCRPDRDNFVTITTSGVDDSGWFATNWAKLTDGTTVGNYDLNSIMHYRTGVSNYKRANGQFYTVTMTAKNGGVGGGSVLTNTDKQALWGIPISANPLRPKAAPGGMAGKVTKVFNTYSNGVTKKWLCTYDPVSGNSNITAINADNTMGNSVQNLNVGTGFNIITPYYSGSFNQCILFYNSANGQVKLYNLIPAGGAIGALITSTFWNSGWTAIEGYTSENKSFWFFQNTSTFRVSIYGVTAAGGLGGLTYTDTWVNWVYSKPFYSEPSLAALTTYFIFRGSDNLTRIRKMPGTGSIGDLIADVYVPGTSLGVWQSGTKSYLATMQGTTLLLYDFDHTGFRTIGGTPIYRAYALGTTLKKIDAAVDFNSVTSNWVNNKMYDYQHVLAYEYTNLPANRFIGYGAPFW